MPVQVTTQFQTAPNFVVFIATTGENLAFVGSCIVIYFYSKTNEMHQFLKSILFCSITLHVSDGLSVHHQEPKIVHTASGIC